MMSSTALRRREPTSAQPGGPELDLEFGFEEFTPPVARLPELSTDDWERHIVGPVSALPATRVLFAGGGTGGHLYPALAIARQLCALAPGSQSLFVGSDRALEKRILAGSGFRHVALPTAPWRGARGAFTFGFQQLRGFFAARRLLKTWTPDVVVGLGGFPSVAPALAARWLGVPLALFEPNAVPGKANKLLGHLAQEAYVHWEATHLGCRCVSTGTPVDQRVLLDRTITPAAARRALGLDPQRPMLLVMGGSQGSSALNRWVADSLDAGVGSPHVTYVHLAGSEKEARTLRAAYARAGCDARVDAFLPGIGLAYRAASLAVVRGGGATLAELQAAEVPGVVVPMPGSADDHQRRNADSFVVAGGVRWLEEDALSARDLGDLIALARDGAALAEHRARSAGRPHAADGVARRLVELTGKTAA
jgi:UDP-N-acetylglucosamine--N-acetylmuramyl-(pentapeptide) pyrophosphoryl-undecaprenol N-acetylglucosamine transferase